MGDATLGRDEAPAGGAVQQRSTGQRTELVWMRPSDHIGWAFDGPAEFAQVAGPFLREGVERGDRVLLVVEDPQEPAYRDLAADFTVHELEVAAIADVYGATGVVDAATQRATFASSLSLAESAGYKGIRVAADNSPLVEGPERFAAWMQWELVADRFMSENNVTGLCGFDRRRTNVDTLRHLATVHPLSAAHDPQPQFRLFVGSEGLCLEGDVDASAIELLERALRTVPAGTPEVVDLRGARVRGARARTWLDKLAASGVALAI